jgi:glycosyltransferase involved in cell wall biosynthesis
MQFLFIHQNFPGQFRHIVKALAQDVTHQVVAIGHFPNFQGPSPLDPKIQLFGYKTPKASHAETHHYLRDFEGHIRRGQEVLRVAQRLKNQGFYPEVIVVHPGWGEALFLQDIFPLARLVLYCEYYYHSTGGDVGFDPEFPTSFDDYPRVRIKNSTQLLSISTCDSGISPTLWQKSLYPIEYQSKLSVIHEGIDTVLLSPDSTGTFTINGHNFINGDEIVTFVARNLEPYRGFHTFLRMLPILQAQRPEMQVIMVGGDDVSYGRRLPEGQAYRDKYCLELAEKVDWTRVHFAGRLPYAEYLKVLQISACHVYLTYPFVLSWSMLEAMSVGCLVVASNTAPVTEVIEHEKNGLLVDFFDIEQLAEGIANVLKAPVDYEAMRQSARQTIVERFDLNSICLPTMVDYLTKVNER